MSAEWKAEPLALDSPEWARLRHVYGQSTDTPNLLRELYAGKHPAHLSSGPLKTLVDSLYHQGDPNTAAYAAAPHLVRLAQNKTGDERRALLHLVGWLEGARSDKRPPIPNSLETAYFSALAIARGLLWDVLGEPIEDPEEFRYLLGAFAVCSGHRELAHKLFTLDVL